MKLQTIVMSAVLGITVFMSGCANKELEQKHSGFLKSYEGLDDDHEKFEGRMVRIMPGADFTKYENIYVAPVQIMSGITEGEQTPAQKKMYQQISEYLTKGYKDEVSKNKRYALVENKNMPKTILFETGISAVAVNYDDMEWYQYTPITLGLTVIARSTYTDKAVRILGEGRLVDAETNKVLMRAMSLQKGEEVGTEADELTFEDVKPALDAWLKNSAKSLENMRKGVIKYEEEK